ncbi:hypothetical protein [Streptomyces sp. NBC_01744]|uniref:hypothetical protein n=1 Tax=Streptomyces sp. NBC_01744 TaxID=2975927 RepID=UPI003D9A403A|nr:hypothetical protein OIE70_36645 [Streptomyces sp. NBC_01744]
MHKSTNIGFDCFESTSVARSPAPRIWTQHRLYGVVHRLVPGRFRFRLQPVQADLSVHDVDGRVAGQALRDVPVHLVQQHLKFAQMLVRGG